MEIVHDRVERALQRTGDQSERALSRGRKNTVYEPCSRSPTPKTTVVKVKVFVDEEDEVGEGRGGCLVATRINLNIDHPCRFSETCYTSLILLLLLLLKKG